MRTITNSMGPILFVWFHRGQFKIPYPCKNTHRGFSENYNASENNKQHFIFYFYKYIGDHSGFIKDVMLRDEIALAYNLLTNHGPALAASTSRHHRIEIMTYYNYPYKFLLKTYFMEYCRVDLLLLNLFSLVKFNNIKS